jgi:enterochelin esterase-like enzyme
MKHISLYLLLLLPFKTWAADNNTEIFQNTPSFIKAQYNSAPYSSNYSGQRWNNPAQRSNNNPMQNNNNSAQHQTFTGKVSGKSIDFSIVLPASYTSGTQRYPVIYWLHGKGGDEKRSTHITRFVDAAVNAGQLPESIIVLPNGGKESFYTNNPDGSWPIETMLIEDLIAYIDANYRTVSNRSGRALMGFSMGGFGALKFASKYPEKFAAVVAYGAPRLDASLGMRGPDTQIYEGVFANDANKFEQNTPAYLFRTNRERVLGQKLAIRLVAGSDDGTQYSVKRLHEVLDELGIKHEYEVLAGARHVITDYYNGENGKGFEFLGRTLKLIK